jgi:hypothetical protein
MQRRFEQLIHGRQPHERHARNAGVGTSTALVHRTRTQNAPTEDDVKESVLPMRV